MSRLLPPACGYAALTLHCGPGAGAEKARSTLGDTVCPPRPAPGTGMTDRTAPRESRALASQGSSAAHCPLQVSMQRVGCHQLPTNARHRIYSRAVTWSGVMSILGSHAGLQGPPVLFLYFPEGVNTPAALWTPRTFKTRRRGAPTTGGAGLGPGRGTLTPSTHRNGAPRLVTGPQNSDFFMPPEL